MVCAANTTSKCCGPFTRCNCIFLPEHRHSLLSCLLQFGVTSAHGPLLSSGLLSGSTDQGSAAARSSAISAQVIKNPQDGKADVVVRLAVAPSYVTYNNNAIQDVVGFFKADSPMELSRLQVIKPQ